MSRIPRRYLVDDTSFNHCFWRSHNLSYVLDDDLARRKLLELIAKYKARFGIRVHSYCLMSSHPHLVLSSPRGQPAFSCFWKLVNYCFARWHNHRHRRRGQVIMQRTSSLLIKPTGAHLLATMRYGDLNPVRASMVRSPKDWPWSSYRFYAYGEANPLIDVAPDYEGLGRTGPQRRRAYRQLFTLPLSAALRVHRPDFVRGGFIGDEGWVREKVAALRRKPPG